MHDHGDQAARAALGHALEGRASEVGRVCNERLRKILGLQPDDPLPEVNAASTSELATSILGRYMADGRAADPEEVQTLARPGQLALHETTTTTLVKLFLAWRDTTIGELRKLAKELQTPEKVLRSSEELVRASCDASLVRMMKRFDEGNRLLERMLADERRQLLHQAAHDQLTGLLNRRAFLDLVNEASGSLGPDESIALMYLDLDGFKVVNDTFGHAFGDRALCAVAERLNTLLRPGDIAGRLGGDEFVVLCRGLRGGVEAAHAVAVRLCDGLSEPVVLDGVEVACPTSLGLACSSDQVDADGLLERADSALYIAKRSGKARIARA